jgi:hypothetical protein
VVVRCPAYALIAGSVPIWRAMKPLLDEAIIDLFHLLGDFDVFYRAPAAVVSCEVDLSVPSCRMNVLSRDTRYGSRYKRLSV